MHFIKQVDAKPCNVNRYTIFPHNSSMTQIYWIIYIHFIFIHILITMNNEFLISNTALLTFIDN